MDDLAQLAIKKALSASWEEAAKINKEILKQNPTDIDALNRLARAQAELGHLPEAKKLAQKVLRLDPTNTIAAKSLEKWKLTKSKSSEISKATSPEAFLEDPGKTKVVPLIFLGNAVTIAKLDPADEVKINTHGHRVSITNEKGEYIGRLPDDIAARIRKLTKLGNKYSVLIKSIKKGEVRVFIREVQRGQKAANIVSFPSEKIKYISFTPPELVRKDKITLPSPDEEEED